MAAAVGQKTIRERLEAFPRGLDGSEKNNPENAIKAMCQPESKFDIDGITLKRKGDAPLKRIDALVIGIFNKFVTIVELYKKPGTEHFDRDAINAWEVAFQVEECIDSLNMVVYLHIFSSNENYRSLEKSILVLWENIKQLNPIK